MRLIWIAAALSLAGCGLQNESVADAHIEQLAVTTLGGDPPEVELEIISGTEGPHCVQASEDTHAYFDGQPMWLWQAGGVVGIFGDSQDCHPPRFVITLPDGGADGDHVFEVIEGDRHLLMQVAHYLVRPTLQLDRAGPLIPGEDAGVVVTPSDLDLAPIESSPGVDNCFGTPLYFAQDGGETCVAAKVDRNRVYFGVPPGLEPGAASFFWCVNCSPPLLPITRCEGADGCRAGEAFLVDPIPVTIAAAP